MKVNRNVSLDLEVLQELEKVRKTNPKFHPSLIINSFLRHWLGLDEENKVGEKKPSSDTESQIEQDFKEAGL